MKSQRVGFIFLLGVLLMLGGPGAVLASDVTDSIKTTVDKVLEIVSSEQYKKDKKLRRQKMRELIDARFSYEQMSMRSLAEEWNKRSDPEKQEFVGLFGKLLENSYASKIESYRDEKINYMSEDIKGEHAMVKTEIQRKDGNIAIDYKMIKVGGAWKVYDFIIEGVSMVRNYRTQFTKIIQKDSFKTLVDKLSAKIVELDADDGKAKNHDL
jgi:phospholipid transport system substrate-binding protein